METINFDIERIIVSGGRVNPLIYSYDNLVKEATRLNRPQDVAEAVRFARIHLECMHHCTEDELN